MIGPAVEPLLSVRGLCKWFPVHSHGFLRRQTGWVKAVDDVNFDLLPGHTLGLVGESGCGKTTTARTILRAMTPTRGSVIFRGTDGPCDLATIDEHRLVPLRTQLQMIFQDPFSSLNPRMTVESIVGEPLAIHRVGTRSERRDRVVEILRKVGLSGDHLPRYPHEFSGGQRQRIGIARALILRPRLVVCDEAVSALDVSVQAQVINLLMDLQEEFSLTYIFVAHDLSVVRHLADDVAVMYAGQLVEVAPVDALFNDPRHPYTQALLSAVPHPDPDIPLRCNLDGEVANPARPPPGCPFHPRCRERLGHCDQEVPALHRLTDLWHVKCHLCASGADRSPADPPAPA